MREIKFRAWDIKSKSMLTVRNIKFDYLNNEFHHNEVDTYSDGKDGKLAQQLGWREQEVELMQFTGLKDKNGKEIYEGDVVRFTQKLNGAKNGSYRISKIKWNIGKRHNGFNIASGQNAEVIGNIYESPELLK